MQHFAFAKKSKVLLLLELLIPKNTLCKVILSFSGIVYSIENVICHKKRYEKG